MRALVLTVFGIIILSELVPVVRCALYRMERPTNPEEVCVLIPVTARGQAWARMEDSFVYQIALMSLVKTLEHGRFAYSVLIGYDVGDAFFDNATTLGALRRWMGTNAPLVSLELVPFSNKLSKPGPVVNFLSRRAYDRGCDFLYSLNDDTELLTPWTSAFVRTLFQFSPPLHGVVGPTCDQGNTAILTHDFVHRSHLDLFGAHHPEELADWWRDDWVSAVYGQRNTRKLSQVVVVHHMRCTRYNVSWGAERRLVALVDEGRALLVKQAVRDSSLAMLDSSSGPVYL